MPYDLIYMWNLKNKTNKRNKIKQKLTIHTESKQVAARGETGGDGCEIGEGD